jgi:hypothetical protein
MQTKVVFWLPYKILNQCNDYRKAAEEKDGSDNWALNYFLETIKVHSNEKLLRNKNKTFFLGHNRPLKT